MGKLNNRYDPAKHHRRSIRYKGHDYTAPGCYFITLNVQDSRCLFGKIERGTMKLSEFGKIVEDEWLKSAEIRPYISLDAYVIMPDHFHGIIVIKVRGGDVDAVDALARATDDVGATAIRPKGPKPKSIGAIIGQFKMQSAKRINALLNEESRAVSGARGRVWQRDYYERIIRNRSSLERVRTYILNNPRKLKTKQRKA